MNKLKTMLNAVGRFATGALAAGVMSGCAVENLTVHNFRTMGMDGDSASTAAAMIDAVAR